MAAALTQCVPHGPGDPHIVEMCTGQSRVPDGQRVYAIGDIHGRFDLASRLIAVIRAEARELPADIEIFVVGLGDFIDRGPQSRQVVDLLCGMTRDPVLSFLGLMGNHEAMLLGALDHTGPSWDDWLDLGGSETLASYGVHGAHNISAGMLRGFVARHLPADHQLFLYGLRNMLVIGDYFFCHAGVRAGLPLSLQTAHDLHLIGTEFSAADDAFEKVIVHGHACVAEPQIRRHRINLDTGAHVSGVLSAVVLEGAEIRLIHSSLG